MFVSVRTQLGQAFRQPVAIALTLLAFIQIPSATGQPVISDRPPQTVTEVETIAEVDRLEHPWGMAWLPEGALLVTERPGRVQWVSADRSRVVHVPGVPAVFAEGQGGLLDVAVHPLFEQTGWVYFTYSAGTIDANHTRVARARFDGEALQDWLDIFSVSQLKNDAQHFGSRLEWLPDGTLLVSIGDGGNPPVTLDGRLIRQQAQNPNSHLGKIVRIRDDGSIPEDNPWQDGTSGSPELWSYGHRNIQGLAVDPATGQVWATEHGARGGDELNAIAPQQNYGWPDVSHSREYFNNQPVAPVLERADATSPSLVWTPAIAPSGLAIYRGDLFADWQGDLFAGGLVSKDVRHIEVAEDGSVSSERSIPIGARVRDISQGPDGYLYVLTDEPNGRLLRLQPV
ncbi:MAG: PQQ-dependent sugar dehydrogenase [Cyanobacteria bacterium J06642_12]